jgi:hypothetical protein
MIGDPGRLEAARDRCELSQITYIQRVGRTNRKRHTVHHDRISRTHALEDFERSATIDHEVLRGDLEPVHWRVIVEDVQVVGTAQTDAETERGKIPPIHR